MGKKRQRRPAPPAGPRNREFAFSRVAGASPNEYAAVSSLAVGALILAPFALLALWWVWWLAVPLLSMAMAVLSLYYITTSAGTLTGRKLALAAIVASTVLGGAGAVRQVIVYRQQQADMRLVRSLAEQACRSVQAGDFDSFYEQLAGPLRTNVPPAHWRYEWQRFMRYYGQPRQIDLGERTLLGPQGEIATTLRFHVEDARRPDAAGRPRKLVVPIRLIYANPAHLAQDERDGSGQSPGEAEDAWRLVRLPAFVHPLPIPYVEPITWPAKGVVEGLVRGLPSATSPKGNLLSPDMEPARGRPAATDEHGQPIVEVQMPLVPRAIWLAPWLPAPPPPPPQGHHRH